MKEKQIRQVFLNSQNNDEHVSRSEHTPNVDVEWLTRLLRILEVPDSDLGLETGYPD
jgi:hypothetical protein